MVLDREVINKIRAACWQLFHGYHDVNHRCIVKICKKQRNYAQKSLNIYQH